MRGIGQTFGAHTVLNWTVSVELSPQAYLLDASIFGDELKDSCMVGIQELPQVLQAEPIILLGDIFIRHFYSVFDIDEQRIKLGVKDTKKHMAKIIDLNDQKLKTINEIKEKETPSNLMAKNDKDAQI